MIVRHVRISVSKKVSNDYRLRSSEFNKMNTSTTNVRTYFHIRFISEGTVIYLRIFIEKPE